MSITNELREYATGWRDRSCHEHLLAIADRIDAEHDLGRTDAYIHGLQSTEYLYDRIDEELSERYVKLPVDADGVPIHIGDTVKLGDGTFEVRRLEFYDMDSWDVVDRFGEPFSPFYMRHIQPDTWERIIDDAQSAYWDGDEIGYDHRKAELVERCRRLAGEE